jgi:hypothetical protein
MADEEDLLLDKLASGDRPSVYAAGLVAARALKETGIAVLMTDVLGRVHLLPDAVIEVKRRPQVTDSELNQMSEDDALQILVRQNETEETIMAYLKRRVSAAAQESL